MNKKLPMNQENDCVVEDISDSKKDNKDKKSDTLKLVD